jgi:hypothetical protein
MFAEKHVFGKNIRYQSQMNQVKVLPLVLPAISPVNDEI